MKQSREPGYYGSKLADSLHELNEASAELRSLKQSILESPLKDYFPKKEGISFHDAVVFAIHKLGESKGELPTEEICIKVISQRIKRYPFLFGKIIL